MFHILKDKIINMKLRGGVGNTLASLLEVPDQISARLSISLLMVSQSSSVTARIYDSASN
jgi:hypothetical protein